MTQGGADALNVGVVNMNVREAKARHTRRSVYKTADDVNLDEHGGEPKTYDAALALLTRLRAAAEASRQSIQTAVREYRQGRGAPVDQVVFREMQERHRRLTLQLGLVQDVLSRYKREEKAQNAVLFGRRNRVFVTVAREMLPPDLFQKIQDETERRWSTEVDAET
jgi:hypothetical protein